MADHLDYGKLGEQRAVTYLKAQGYQIISLNWRYKHLEVDIIAKDGDTLVFAEVKARKSTAFGYPESFVDRQKQNNLIRAADIYLAMTNYEGEIRFDIVSVYLQGDTHIELIKDAFWSN